MDLTAAMGKFFTDEGEIRLPDKLTLAGLSEAIYQVDRAQGNGDHVVLRDWDFSTAPTDSEGSSSHEGVAREFTRTEVNTRIKAVAARLEQVTTLGDRAAILAGNCAEYLFSFMGALYAGVIPVPLYDPTEPGHAAHLKAVFDDAAPSVVLTSRVSARAVRSYFAELPGAQRPRIIAVDSLPDTVAQQWTNPLELEAAQKLEGSGVAPIDFPAFLQYTSGSTRTPAGVELTNRSIVSNVVQIFRVAKLRTPLRLVDWIPLHHDMGIILGIFVIILGLEFDLLTPRDFIQRPGRWIRMMGVRPGEADAGTPLAVYSAVPNFALELSVRYGTPDDGEQVDLSAIDGILLGAEPITERSIENFARTFGQFGLRRSALRPSYGLAEASLLVTTPQTPNRPLISHFDRAALTAGEVKLVDPAAEDSVSFVSNGQVVPPQVLTVVDPETHEELPDSVIGELWTRGDNTATGYLGREQETAETFSNTLGKRLETGSRAEGEPDEGWMATGDLGAIVDHEVYVTGRRKDLIVVAGRNHYPQDIEATVAAATEQVNPDAVAAFSVPGEDVEELIVLTERADAASAGGDEEAVQAIRSAVTKTHGVAPAVVRVQDPNSIPRTSSAKIARRAAAKQFAAGQDARR